jgi:hypothetical protein
MKCSLLLAVAILFVAGCGTLAIDHRIVYAPAEGVVLTRTHLTEWEASEQGVGSTGIDWIASERIVVTDEIREVEEGRPRELRRTFTELASGSWWAMGDVERVLTSELAGRTVVISWDEGEQGYRYVPAEGQEIDEALLAGLAEDMDCRGFLPDGDVEPGDFWALDAGAFKSIAWAGGIMSFHDEGVLNDEMERRYQLASRQAQQAEGTAFFEGVLVTDGPRLAVISFRFETKARFEILDGGESPGGALRCYERTGIVKGELRWDLDHGHLHSITAETERVSVSFVRYPDDPEGGGRQAFSGKARHTVTVERG